jgi:hypothetical protein
MGFAAVVAVGAGADVLVAAGAAGADVLVAAGATGAVVDVGVDLLPQEARMKLRIHASVMSFTKLVFISFSSMGNYID